MAFSAPRQNSDSRIDFKANICFLLEVSSPKITFLKYFLKKSGFFEIFSKNTVYFEIFSKNHDFSLFVLKIICFGWFGFENIEQGAARRACRTSFCRGAENVIILVLKDAQTCFWHIKESDECTLSLLSNPTLWATILLNSSLFKKCSFFGSENNSKYVVESCSL